MFVSNAVGVQIDTVDKNRSPMVAFQIWFRVRPTKPIKSFKHAIDVMNKFQST